MAEEQNKEKAAPGGAPGGGAAAPASPAAPPAPSIPATPAALAAAQLADTRDVITKTRERADRTAKLFGTIGVALAGYLGVSKLDAIFPFEPALAKWWVWLLFALSILVFVFGIIDWVRLLGRVGAPLGLKAKEPLTQDAIGDPPNGLDATEIQLVKRVFDQHAEINGFDSLAELQADLHRRALELEPPARPSKAKTDEIALDNAHLRLTLARAAADVVRHRYSLAFTSVRGQSAIGLTVIGYVGLALSTAFLAGESSGTVKRASDCAALDKAQKDAGVVRLAPPCEAFVRGTTPTATTPAATTPAGTTPAALKATTP